ncbi:protein bassoon-like isoform X2 [Passer domesticus]|uniref:protein bassoon-like isoform X2 n=1 Tax=Passer domesticus TaxID=48849 RepID=UPI0030FEF824
MALALRLLLLLLLAVALPARAAQAAPLQARRADWNRDMGFQEVLMKHGLKFLEDAGAEPAGEGLTSRTEPLGDAEGLSAGRRFIRPLVVIANKTSPHGRVPPKRKMQDTTEKISLEPSKKTKQELKEMRQGGQEMKGEPVQKEAFPRGSSGSVPASAEGREAMPGTGDEVSGRASPSAWMNKVLKPLEPPADVSTGRTSPAPTLDVAIKPSSHHRRKIQDTTDKISLEPSKQIRQELKEALQTRQEMDIVLQWKLAFLEGSTPSLVPAPVAGRKAIPDTGTGTADWEAGKDSALAWRSEVVKPSEHSADVSAGTTSPTPTLDAAPKPSSHHRGPTTGETKGMAGKKFQDPLEVMWQMLKECLQRKQEMKGEPVQKEALPGGSSGSVPASAAGRETMPGTGPGDEVAGKASPSAWMNKVLKPLEPPADMSPGRTSPAPTLDAALKPSSHGRGPPPEETKVMADKKFQNLFEIMWQMLKEMLQRRQGVDCEPVQMEAYAGGSSGSVPASAEGREAMPGTGTGAEPAGEGPTSRTEALGDAEGVSAGRTSPAPGLDAWPQPSSHGRGPPKGKTQDTTAKMSHEADEFLTQTQKEAPGGQVMDQKAVQKEEHSGRSSGSLAAPAAERKAMPDTGTGTADAAGTTRPVPNAQDGLGRGFCQGTGCWLGFLAGMLYLELVFMLFCIGIWYSWNRKQSTSGQELEDGGCTSHPDSVGSSSSSRNGLDSPLKCSVKRTPEQPSTRKPLIAP